MDQMSEMRIENLRSYVIEAIKADPACYAEIKYFLTCILTLADLNEELEDMVMLILDHMCGWCNPEWSLTYLKEGKDANTYEGTI